VKETVIRPSNAKVAIVCYFEVVVVVAASHTLNVVSPSRFVFNLFMLAATQQDGQINFRSKKRRLKITMHI
jgi:hypothetical protein